ncbi:MAG: sporulation protein YunB [Ruminococcaceae bacterium]|nr:sporulation protein YunB [Oscillospiraceae bacterium]
MSTRSARRKSPRGFLQKLGIKLIALSLIVLGLLFLADLSFRPMVESINAYQCHEMVSKIINDAVLAEIEREGAQYSTLVNLTANAEGEIVSVESNVMNINRLKTEVAERIEREIERMSAVNIEIPIGTLLGLQVLHGKGFNVGMSVVPVGYATTTVISEFTEAGINQTLHRIIIEINADVDALIPGFSTRVPVSTSIIAAETIIVGRVPEAYTHVVTESSDLAGTLNDFGAVIS